MSHQVEASGVQQTDIGSKMVRAGSEATQQMSQCIATLAALHWVPADICGLSRPRFDYVKGRLYTNL